MEKMLGNGNGNGNGGLFKLKNIVPNSKILGGHF